VGKALRIVGGFDYTWLTFERSMGLISSDEVDVTRVVTHRFPPEKIEDAFEVVVRRDSVKAMILP
jgi:threonine dehydrogenase-like Zn-dependent dehydrogenase